MERPSQGGPPPYVGDYSLSAFCAGSGIFGLGTNSFCVMKFFTIPCSVWSGGGCT